MADGTRAGFTPNLVVGIGVTLLGVVLTLDKLGVIGAMAWLRFWPVLLILLGTAIVWQALRGSPGDRPPAPILSAPLVILLVIAGLVASRTSTTAGTAGAMADADRTVSVHAVMSGNRHAVAGRPFRHGEITAVMGESRLDLRGAVLGPGEEAVIDVVTVMGSTIVFVPMAWEINFEAVPVMGGVKDERPRPGAEGLDDDEENAGAPPPAVAPPADDSATGAVNGPRPRLVIRGFVMMGSLVIRS
jgi:hypothetical protein